MERFFPAVLLAVFICAACGGPGAEETLAVINGNPVTRQQFNLKAKLYGLTVNTPGEEEQFLNLLINDMLVLEQAKKMNIRLSGEQMRAEMENFAPDYDTKETKKALKDAGIRYGEWKKDLKEKIIRKKVIETAMSGKINIRPDEVRDFYWTNILEFRTIKRARARQIVLNTEEKAKEVQQELMRGGDFAALAEKYSVTSEAKLGGDLGYFGEKEMPVFITSVVFSMKKGEISPVVRSPYGWHILKCEDIQEADTPKFEQVRQEAYDRYYEQKKEEYFNAWMEELREAARIEIKGIKTEKKKTEVGK
ncbi:MAG: peptidylprolyl isomerase [Spirochaetia bacterium]|nr:peptidylprolyl isomerase [Spirochaetia bacterium]